MIIPGILDLTLPFLVLTSTLLAIKSLASSFNSGFSFSFLIRRLILNTSKAIPSRIRAIL